MAASVTAHMLSDAIIFQDWPHFECKSKYWTVRMRSLPAHFSPFTLRDRSFRGPTSEAFILFVASVNPFIFAVAKSNCRWLKSWTIHLQMLDLWIKLSVFWHSKINSLFLSHRVVPAMRAKLWLFPPETSRKGKWWRPMETHLKPLG